MAGCAIDLRGLEEELKKLGITIVSGSQDTIISIRIRGLAGKALVRGLRLADQLLQERVKGVIKSCADAATKTFTDPTFGPSASDSGGAAAICKMGQVVPSKGGSQHQVKILGLLKSEKIRWERPVYVMDDEDDGYVATCNAGSLCLVLVADSWRSYLRVVPVAVMMSTIKRKTNEEAPFLPLRLLTKYSLHRQSSSLMTCALET